VDPTWGTRCKLFDALGEEQPDWTRLRAFLDSLARHPDLAEHAIRAKPRPSGSEFLDNVLAGIAEKVAEDSSIPRPAWTRKASTKDGWDWFVWRMSRRSWTRVLVDREAEKVPR
jgi:hypothetical protein